jgi:pimeloyl-ACP methyl ester carboxylesterase
MRLTIDGLAAFAATGGRDFDAALPTAIFIHGAGFDSSTWALHSRWFAHHGWSVLALDLPGHGRSQASPLATIPRMADWVLSLIDTLGIAKAALIGHSMGALIALDAASRRPDKISSLALIGAAAAMPVNSDLLAAAKANSRAAIDMISLWGLGNHATQGGSRAPGLWMLGTAVRLLERANPGVLYNDLAACNDYKTGAETAKKIACPTTIIAGQRDLMTPLKAGKTLAAAIGGARLVVIEGAGHMAMIERPDEVLDALRQL